MIVGDGGNIVVQAGDEGVLVIDTGLEARGDELLAAIRRISDKPIRLVINTHVHADHTGANETIARVGESLGGNAPGNSGLALATARVLAHEKVMTRMSAPSGQTPPRPFGAWPTETFFSDDKEIFFNDEAIQLIYQPGHTDGDVLVFFRRSDVVASGDLFLTTTYPVIDVARGGSVQGIINGLNRLLDITIPKDKAEGGTYVVPGHGRLSDEADVVEYRDMLTIVRDRIQDLIAKGKSLAEVKAAGVDARLRRPLRRDHWSHGPRISSSRPSIASWRDGRLSATRTLERWCPALAGRSLSPVVDLRAAVVGPAASLPLVTIVSTLRSEEIVQVAVSVAFRSPSAVRSIVLASTRLKTTFAADATTGIFLAVESLPCRSCAPAASRCRWRAATSMSCA